MMISKLVNYKKLTFFVVEIKPTDQALNVLLKIAHMNNLIRVNMTIIITV